MSKRTMYDILEVSRDASKDDIIVAYATKKNNLVTKKNEGIIETSEYSSALEEIDNAYRILVNTATRAEYDIAIASETKSSDPAKASGEPTTDKTVNPTPASPANGTGATPGKAEGNHSFLKGLALGACIVALGVSVVSCSLLNNKEKLHDLGEKYGIIEVAETIEPTPDITVEVTEVPAIEFTAAPTAEPTEAPTIEFTATPTARPSATPTVNPTKAPTTEPTAEPTEAPTEVPTAEPTVEPTEAPTPEMVMPAYVPGMANYGDATDDAYVTQEALALLEEMNANGLYNIGTENPYTVDELKALIQYMNGAYKPLNEDEAYTMRRELENFALAPLNSEHLMFAVQYHGGEDSFKETVEGHIANYRRINIVDHMLMGNSSAYPYLKWFEDQYNRMLCTTDRELCTEIYDSMMQSLADIVYGDGFTLDGKVYTEACFLGKDRVNSGNILQVLVYMMEPLRTRTTQSEFMVTNSLVSANPEENTMPVEYLQITEYFNMNCDNLLSEIAVDDEGYLLIDQDDEHNFSYINQVNTINNALRMFYGNRETYTNVYTKSIN